MSATTQKCGPFEVTVADAGLVPTTMVYAGYPSPVLVDGASEVIVLPDRGEQSVSEVFVGPDGYWPLVEPDEPVVVRTVGD